MKLRYYLRGLGIGILVTALIMGMTSKAGRPLTDAEIRAKALTLGMVDPNDLSLSALGGASGQSGSENGEESGQEPGEGSSSPDIQGTQEPGNQESEDLETENPETENPETENPETENPATENPETENPETENFGRDNPETEGNETEEPEPTPTLTPTPSPTPVPSPTPTLEPVSTGETVTIRIVRGDSSYTVSRRLEEAGLIESAKDYDTYLVDNGYSKTIRTGTYQVPVGATWEEIAKIIA